jgi:hypothetical protein
MTVVSSWLVAFTISVVTNREHAFQALRRFKASGYFGVNSRGMG